MGSFPTGFASTLPTAQAPSVDDPGPIRRQGLALRIQAALPQTQCRRCGYVDCAAYAQAIASGRAPIDRCAPGGAEGVRRLAAITEQPARPLDASVGTEGPRSIAWIVEDECIGCTLCAKACPVDCIVGSNKLMHTVIEAQCTGCELCVAACPVDCIRMENASGTRTGWDAWSPADAEAARLRYEARQARAQRRKAKPASRARPSDRVAEPVAASTVIAPRRAAIRAALERARSKRSATAQASTHEP